MITPIKPYLIGGVVLSVVLFLGAFYLRGLELDACEAKIAAIDLAIEQAEKDYEQAIKRQSDLLKQEQTRRERLLREIDLHDKNVPAGPATLDALRLLCNQGATCANPEGASNPST